MHLNWCSSPLTPLSDRWILPAEEILNALNALNPKAVM